MVELDGSPERSMLVRREPDTRRMAIQVECVVETDRSIQRSCSGLPRHWQHQEDSSLRM